MITRKLTVTDLVMVTARDPAESVGPEGPYVLPASGLVREAAFRWFRQAGVKPAIAAEPDGHEALLALVALGYGAGIVPRLVLECSASADRLVEIPSTPALPATTIGLCVRRTDLRRPLVAALWSLSGPMSRSRDRFRPLDDSPS
jgi:LysR family positive regulator for ilvC